MGDLNPVRVAVITGGHSYDVPNFHLLFRALPGIDAYIQHMNDFASSPQDVRNGYDVVLFYTMFMDEPTDEGLPWHAGKPLTALQGLRDEGKVQPGQKVLINGASGGVGTFAVQIAKVLGAEVTGVCSTRNVELVRSLGADHVVDYTQEDFTRSGRRYDLILDNAASHSFGDLKRALTPEGVILPNSGHGGMGYVIKSFALAPFMRQLGRMYMAQSSGANMKTLAELIEAGQVTPVIDRSYPFAEIPAALGYAAQGHARGKVVIAVEPSQLS